MSVPQMTVQEFQKKLNKAVEELKVAYKEFTEIPSIKKASEETNPPSDQILPKMESFMKIALQDYTRNAKEYLNLTEKEKADGMKALGVGTRSDKIKHLSEAVKTFSLEKLKGVEPKASALRLANALWALEDAIKNATKTKPNTRLDKLGTRIKLIFSDIKAAVSTHGKERSAAASSHTPSTKKKPRA